MLDVRHSYILIGPMKWTRRSWRHLVIVLAVLAVFTSVATRSFDYSSVHQPTAQCDSLKVERQHLDTDALALAKPMAQLVDTLLPVAAPHAPPREFPVVSVELAEYLYNRPPPACSLL